MSASPAHQSLPPLALVPRSYIPPSYDTWEDFSDDPDDHAGLIAWTDAEGRFFAVGGDDVVREYGDGDEDGERLAADMARRPRQRTSPLDLADDPVLTRIDIDPAVRLIDRAIVALIVLTILGIALQFARAWLAGRL